MRQAGRVGITATRTVVRIDPMPVSTPISLSQCWPIPYRAALDRPACLRVDTSRRHSPDRLPCDGGRHGPTNLVRLRPLDALSWARAHSPFASHQRPISARLSPLGGSELVSDRLKSSNVTDGSFRPRTVNHKKDRPSPQKVTLRISVGSITRPHLGHRVRCDSRIFSQFSFFRIINAVYYIRRLFAHNSVSQSRPQ